MRLPGGRYRSGVRGRAEEGKRTTMQCPQCHAYIDGSEEFCGNCGAKLQPQTAADATRVAGTAPVPQEAPTIPPAPSSTQTSTLPPLPSYAVPDGQPTYDPSMYEETITPEGVMNVDAPAPSTVPASPSTVQTGAVPPPLTPPSSGGADDNGGKPPKSNRGLLITLIVLVVIMLAAIGFWWWQSTHKNDEASASASASQQETTASDDSEDASDDADANDDDKDDKDDKDKDKTAKCKATPDVDVDDLTAHGTSLVATLDLSAKSCESGTYAEPNIKVTVKNDDGDVIASAIYDFAKQPITFEDGEAHVDIAFDSRQHWQPADEITSPTNAKVIWQTGAKAEGKPAADVDGALGGASIDTVDNERYAQLALKRQLDDDSSSANTFYSDYTTQLSSKKYNMNINGKVWKYTDIYEQFLKLHYKHPNAILIWASDYYNYTKHGHAADYYVILSGEEFASADDASAWCPANGYAAEDCVAVDLE